MKNLVVSFLAGLISAVLFVALNNHFYAKTVAVVRVDKLIAEHLKEYGEKDLSQEKRLAITEAYAKRLDKVINDISEQDNVVLLVGPAVVSPVPDYTDIVRQRVGGFNVEN